MKHEHLPVCRCCSKYIILLLLLRFSFDRALMMFIIYDLAYSTYKINPQRTFDQQFSFTLVSAQKCTLVVE